jgi:hypothetical protein
MAFLLGGFGKQLVGIAVVAIAAGQCVGMTQWALVVAVHMNKLHLLAAEETGLWLHGMNIPNLCKQVAPIFSTGVDYFWHRHKNKRLPQWEGAHLVFSTN